MNLSSIQWPIFNPYEKATVELYISGCTRNCKGCHNPELQEFSSGEKLDIDEIIKKLLTKEQLFSIISISGGDLLCQKETEAISLVDALKSAFPNKEMWLFTGESDFKNIPYWAKDKFDVIKYGPYIHQYAQEGFPSSTNQRIWRKHEN